MLAPFLDGVLTLIKSKHATHTLLQSMRNLRSITLGIASKGHANGPSKSICQISVKSFPQLTIKLTSYSPGPPPAVRTYHIFKYARNQAALAVMAQFP